ncbi:hypothetical protein AWB76_02799 [Caballeronia temeraria]|uniref:Uncharacterized protein n=1 Tax=Caballeronia temeraria TaxID=1777137 RepID=A0A158AQE8_9BURK|nr:hypothetical protein [Caballeronia temeraria]SAK59716.1 hypothetical protein AWB76_02799 [Caballeronia temeraria]
MNIYGYKNEEGELLSLNEVSLKVTLDELKGISKFIEHVILQMETYGDDFGHEHLSDFLKLRGIPEIVIAGDS